MLHVIDESTREIVRADYVPLDSQDSRGRKVGALVLVERLATRAPARFSAHSGEVGYLAPGAYFRATVQAARGGKAFGATQPGKLFETLADASAYVDQRIAASLAARKGK